MKTPIEVLRRLCVVGTIASYFILAHSLSFSQTLDKLAPCVVFLEVAKTRTIQIDGVPHQLYVKKLGEDTPKPLADTLRGTGFFIVRNDGLYLVTADHVAQHMDTSATLTIRSKADVPLRFSILDFLGNNKAVNWTSSKEADVAVLRLFPTQQLFQNLQEHFLPFDILVANEEAPMREKTLTMLGFPLGLGVTGRFSPISQESKASSGLLMLQRADNRAMATFFLLDKPCAGGFSGAPVFEIPAPYSSGGTFIVGGGRLSCVGLVHGTLSDETGGKFGAVVPSSFIVKAMMQAQ
jgi:hypothetical protein